MLRRRAVSVACLLVVALVVVVPSVSAGSLDVKPGLWKKKMTITSAGVTDKPMTIEVCLTKKNLDFDAFLQGFADKTCKWTKQDVSPKRIDVALVCQAMSAVSLTEVKSPERVVVKATISTKPRGETISMTSSEEWTWVGPDCPKPKQAP